MKNKTLIAIMIALLVVPAAMATITITPDKETYAPGENITLAIDYTNNGTKTVTAQYTHIQIKKFGIQVMEQTTQQKKTLMPEQIDTGTHILALPSFAPSGKYEITGYVEHDDKSTTEKKTITINTTESLMFKIIKWIVIALAIIIILLIIMNIAKAKKKPKEDTEPVSKEEKDELKEKTKLAVEGTADEKVKKQKREEEIAKAEAYLSTSLPNKTEEKKPVKKETPKETKNQAKVQPQKTVVMPISGTPTDDAPEPIEEESEGKYKDEM